MLTMMMFLFLQELFVGVGAGGGTSFTDTSIHPHVVAGATVYPTSGKVGAFYRFSWSNPSFSIKQPFSFHKGEKLHVTGISVRFAKGGIQPFLEPGVAWYLEHVNIKLFGNDILDEEQGRFAGAMRGGIAMRVWNRLYFTPSASLVGGRRPLWQADAGFSWKFGGGR